MKRWLIGPLVLVAVAWVPLLTAGRRSLGPSSTDANPPGATVKLVFVHHSSGEGWLEDVGSWLGGGLGAALAASNYFVSDTNYGWGPADRDEGDGTIGDHTDIGHWYSWFAGPNRATYVGALLAESGQYSSYTRLQDDPGGPNRVVLFKSCFPNSALDGSPSAPPTTGANPLRGESSSSEHMTVANAKGIYNDILAFFASRQDVLWVVVTAPPLSDPTYAANARVFNRWLVDDWLDSYPYANVAVFDFFNVLTSNGGSAAVNDLGWASGNHHRVWNGQVQYVTNQGSNTSAYPSSSGDDHPSAAGNRKASGELVPLLNVFYNRWRATSGTPTPSPTATPRPSGTPAPTPSAQRPVRRRLACAPTPTANAGCPGGPATYATSRDLRQPPPLAEPPARRWFADPAFGSCLLRVTDRHADRSADDPSGGMKNEYSRVQSFNSDGSRLLIRGTAATWYLYDAHTFERLRQLDIWGVDPRWHATDPRRALFVDGTALYSIDVESNEVNEVHDFAPDLPGHDLSVVWTRYEGSPSRDGRWWGLMAEDQDWLASAFLVYDLAADRVVAVRDQRSASDREADSVTITSLGTYFLAFYEPCAQGTLGTAAHPCGMMVWDRNLTSARGVHRNAGHGDVALDAAGREVFVFQDNDTDHISMMDLASGAVTPLLELDFALTHPVLGLHVSGRALERPGWVVISTHDAAAASHIWMDDHVFLLELKQGGRVVRLAHTRSVVDAEQEHDYWAEPHASANAELTRILFTTNWGRSGTDQVETFVIALPPDWLQRLR